MLFLSLLIPSKSEFHYLDSMPKKLKGSKCQMTKKSPDKMPTNHLSLGPLAFSLHNKRRPGLSICGGLIINILRIICTSLCIMSILSLSLFVLGKFTYKRCWLGFLFTKWFFVFFNCVFLTLCWPQWHILRNKSHAYVTFSSKYAFTTAAPLMRLVFQKLISMPLLAKKIIERSRLNISNLNQLFKDLTITNLKKQIPRLH